ATTDIYTLSLHDALPICLALVLIERLPSQAARSSMPMRSTWGRRRIIVRQRLAFGEWVGLAGRERSLLLGADPQPPGRSARLAARMDVELAQDRADVMVDRLGRQEEPLGDLPV